MNQSLSKYNIRYVDKEEYRLLSKEIFNDGCYDFSLSKSNPFIIDVGSHIGLSVIYFKDRYPNANIMCFEPNPNTFLLLEENISSNNIQGVEFKNIGVGKSDCVRTLYIDASGRECFSTASFNKNAWDGTQDTIPISVRIERLSKYIDKDVDLLKIDAEGAELEILKELESSGKLHFIQNIILEYHPTNGMKKENILKVLKDFKISFRGDNLSSKLIYILGEKSFK